MRGQQSQERSLDIRGPSIHVFVLILWDSKALPDQWRDIAPPPVLSLLRGLLSVGHAQNTQSNYLKTACPDLS